MDLHNEKMYTTHTHTHTHLFSSSYIVMRVVCHSTIHDFQSKVIEVVIDARSLELITFI